MTCVCRHCSPHEGFQSIGVTKDWRPCSTKKHGGVLQRFQSIGVTKDWRLDAARAVQEGEENGFPINRRHQGLATLEVLYG